jgi:Coenzyme PQQ synthesis protein D (PqqD)
VALRLIPREGAAPTDRWERMPSIRWTVIEGRVVLIDANEAELLHLNEVGSRVWALLDGTRSVAELVDEIHAEFDVSPARLSRDVRRFVGTLHRMELIRKAGSTAS